MSEILTMDVLEKALKNTASTKKWCFIGGLATAVSAIIEYLSPTFTFFYFLSQVLLAVFCLCYCQYLNVQQKKIRSQLDVLSTEHYGKAYKEISSKTNSAD